MPTSNIVVRELLIYPIKSCGAVQVDVAQTTRYGLSLPSNPLLSDRRWMIIQEDRPRSQLHFPQMALICPLFTPYGLKLDAPGMPSLTIPYSPLPEDIIEIEYVSINSSFVYRYYCFILIEKINIKGRRYGENVSNWFSTFLKTPDLQLVYFDEQFEPQHVKDIEPEHPNEALNSDVVSYHDMSPFHLGSLESIDDLNKRLENPIKIHNFRPNIIVSGLDKPYDEDYWRIIQIGDKVKLRWFRSCLRCLLPNTNQQTGTSDPNKEPWTTLRTYRRKPELYGISAQFGTYLATYEDGLIRVGDPVFVLQEDKNF